jgi:pimeloyl-ACP methyl ester carboxylesterase
MSRTVATVTAIGLTLLLVTGAAAERANGVGPEPTVVLVHGGWSDASVWDAVITRLQQEGFQVIAPPNPLRGPVEDAAYVASVLDTLTGPLILVGASDGGIVISNAAAMTHNAQNVQSLVYVAAFIPDVGERGVDLTPLPGSLVGASTLQVRPCPAASCPGGADLYLDTARFRAVMASDLPLEKTSVLAATQRGVSATAGTEKSEFAAWHTVPSFAIVATEDNAIGAANERMMAQRAHAQTVEVDASHMVMVSHPDAVVSLIDSAAGKR